ncbi:MAG: hypothetical protein GF401_18560 [Chitinivibrionales bacterium]|nr:hypothetical protein [Chitinivibrionales bacterium]
MNHQVESIVSRIKIVLEDRVEFALLFGSVLTENFADESDIDCAAYFKEPPKSFSDRAQLIIDLEDALQKKFDMIFLNSSDIIITMQVLANGELVINNDPGKFVVYKAQKISEYIDFKKSRKIIEDSMLRGRIYA